jgi:3-methyladenine DNA glycosylase AlkD
MTIKKKVADSSKSPIKPPTVDSLMAELESLGSAQTRKTYLRHGASEPLFGVKFGDLRPLQKQVGHDQSLACQLWETGNCDAMTLALLVADPAGIRSGTIDAWLRDSNYDLLTGMLADLTAKSTHRMAKWKKWSRAKSERALVAAYSLLASWLVEEAASVPQNVIDETLRAIETSIHDQPNRARHGMNQALIAIGIYREDYRQRAYAVAKAIGKVHVDHGDTSCKTPDAKTYIDRVLASPHRRKSNC